MSLAKYMRSRLKVAEKNRARNLRIPIEEAAEIIAELERLESFACPMPAGMPTGPDVKEPPVIPAPGRLRKLPEWFCSCGWEGDQGSLERGGASRMMLVCPSCKQSIIFLWKKPKV